MLLVDARIGGFRRFAPDQPSKLLVDARLICLIGSNEAGKSSILDVLSGSHQTDVIPSTDRTRRLSVADDYPVVVLRYRLDSGDVEAVSHLYASAERRPTWFVVTKSAGGTINLEPDLVPARSVKQRRAVRDVYMNDDVRARLVGSSIIEGSELDWILEMASLESDTDFDDSQLGVFEALAARIREAEHDDLAEYMEMALKTERAKHPAQEVRDDLWARTPDFIAFTDSDRQLESEYDLRAVAAEPPTALANLARLSDLDLPGLLTTIDAGESGTVEYLERNANENLAKAFKAWTQIPPITVTLNVSGTTLNVHVTSGSDVPMRLGERSSGLREFVALVAATAQKSPHGPPVLLIDEIETHLHYDAQVDLVNVLVTQTQSTDGHEPPIGQIIYSTHSAACLPEDLGNVRVVEADVEATRSRVRNQFWTDEPGLGPLLMAMGAATLAFVPRRAALVAEGPCELILLPTLLKQALGMEHLGFQVAPGSANARPGTLIGFDLQAPRTAWVVDGDAGGRALAKKLTDDGIDAARIFQLGGEGSGLMLENLVDEGAYREAVRRCLSDLGIKSDGLDSVSLDGDRPRAIKEFCVGLTTDAISPSKIMVANRLLSMKSERRLVAENHVALLRAFHAAATDTLAN